MRRRLPARLALHGALAAVLAYSLFPFYWALNTSLKTGTDLFGTTFWPPSPTLANYVAVFRGQAFGTNLLNSLLVASSTVTVSLGLGLLAAFALARGAFRGRSLLLLTFLGVSMFPQIAVLSGLFDLIRGLGLYNHWAGLALSYLIFTLPFTVWVLSTFLREIPRGIEEAARLDGAGPLTLIFRIFLPMLWPGIIATGLLAFIAAWNEFLFALTLTLSDRARTVPVAIFQMNGSSQFELPWGQIMAASMIVTLPVLVLVWVFQRRIMAGLTAGAMKG